MQQRFTGEFGYMALKARIAKQEAREELRVLFGLAVCALALFGGWFGTGYLMASATFGL